MEKIKSSLLKMRSKTMILFTHCLIKYIITWAGFNAQWLVWLEFNAQWFYCSGTHIRSQSWADGPPAVHKDHAGFRSATAKLSHHPFPVLTFLSQHSTGPRLMPLWALCGACGMQWCRHCIGSLCPWGCVAGLQWWQRLLQTAGNRTLGPRSSVMLFRIEQTFTVATLARSVAICSHSPYATGKSFVSRLHFLGHSPAGWITIRTSRRWVIEWLMSMACTSRSSR